MVSKAACDLAVPQALERCAFLEWGRRCQATAACWPVATWKTQGGDDVFLLLDLPHCPEHKEIADAMQLPLGAVDWNRIRPQIRRLRDVPRPETLALQWHDRPYLTCSFCGRTDTSHAEDCLSRQFHDTTEDSIL
jgi:hypothetical protein